MTPSEAPALTDRPPAAGRAARKRPGIWRFATATLITGGTLAVSGWLVFLSPVLGVKEIRVEGVLGLAPEQIEQAAALPLDTPMATVDVEAVRQRVAAVTEVESARVERVWPGTVIIRIRERTALASVPMNGKSAVVDRFGVVLDIVAVAPPKLPVVRLPHLDPQDPAVRAALTVLGVLPDHLLRKVHEVQAKTADSVTLLLSDGRTVIFGGPERAADKTRILLGLLDQRAETFDVSSPEVVTVR
ncbi:cell division protein FtsQ/DivIB [Herbidospora cretacea]|uniref:cell division protein FtsQ/DivIB n=1 Tax=Herbidospora cretacea TaxID=28444 RepID=UPI00068CD79E|nr:FtsQ-type POTRA domain-containing protein [Herbidospora cretacea]